MKTIFSVLDDWSSKSIWRLSLLIVVILICLYMLIGDSVTLEPLFVIPVIIASWYGSNKAGILLSCASAAILILVQAFIFKVDLDLQTVLLYSFPYVIAYSCAAILITNFRNVHRVEVDVADTDYLTGISNSRSFFSDLANELVRSNRYNRVFSLAYLDLDNFKYINDTKGHEVGDQLLKEVADCLHSNLRKTDIVARLGGDEFACLLPETKQDSARKAFLKLNGVLLERMKEHNWPVSFSVGVVTFEKCPDDVNQAVKLADDLMYSVKNNEKNAVAYKVWGGEAA